MVEISSSALGGGNPAIGALTGLMSGFQSGFVQGRQLQQQQNLLQLQREAGMRAEKGLQLESDRLGLIKDSQAFHRTQWEYERQQQERDEEIANAAGPLIALAGDSAAVDRFVTSHQAKGTGMPFGGVAPDVLDPRLRSAYRRTQFEQLQEATKGGSPGLQTALFGKFQEAAKGAEEQRARKHLAEDFSMMMQSWEKAATDIGEKLPSWLTDDAELLLQNISENPEAFDYQALQEAKQDLAQRTAAYLGPRQQMFSQAERATQAIDAIEGAHPAVGAKARTDTNLMKLGIMSPQEHSQRMTSYAHGNIPVFHNGQMVAEVKTPEQEQELIKVYREYEAAKIDQMRAAAEAARAQAWRDRNVLPGSGAGSSAYEKEVGDRFTELVKARNSNPMLMAKPMTAAEQEEMMHEARRLTDIAYNRVPADTGSAEDKAAAGFSDFFGETLGVQAPPPAAAPAAAAPAPVMNGQAAQPAPAEPPPPLIPVPVKRGRGAMLGASSVRTSAIDKLRSYATAVGRDAKRHERERRGEQFKAGIYESWEKSSGRLEEAIRQFAQFYGDMTREELEEIERLRSGHSNR